MSRSQGIGLLKKENISLSFKMYNRVSARAGSHSLATARQCQRQSYNLRSKVMSSSLKSLQKI